jgi:C-terminal processing protease CtpA/Prc
VYKYRTLSDLKQSVADRIADAQTVQAGRLVAASSFKVGFGYRVALPVAAYFSWQGNNLEGRGVLPDIEERLSPEALWNGEDNQLGRAKRSFAELATSQATA